MSESNVLGFYYGALADHLEVQAVAQGYTLGEKAAILERAREALNVLYLGGFLSDGEKDKLKQKLHKQVMKSLRRPEEDAE